MAKSKNGSKKESKKGARKLRKSGEAKQKVHDAEPSLSEELAAVPTPAQSVAPVQNEAPTKVENVHQKGKKMRGMSFDQKCEAIHKLMRDSNSFFKIPELEGLGRSVGVVPQSVKEVVLTLVSEGKVMNEKVGSQQIFWSLVSGDKAKLLKREEKLSNEIAMKEQNIAALTQQKRAMEQTAPPAEVAQTAKVEADKLNTETRQMQQTMQNMSANNPIEIKKKKSLLEQMMDEANRCGENAETARDWILDKKRGEITVQQLNEHFGFPEEFECLDIDEWMAKMGQK
eukprot:gene908-169_t